MPHAKIETHIEQLLNQDSTMSMTLLPYIMALQNNDEELLQEYELLYMHQVSHEWMQREKVCYPVESNKEEMEGMAFCKGCGQMSRNFCPKTCDLVCFTCGLAEYRPGLYTGTPGLCNTYCDELEHSSAKHHHYYSRVANFKSILRNLEGTPVPLNGDKMKKFISKYKGQLNKCSFMKLRKLMRKHGVSSYYNKIHYIMTLVNKNYSPVRLTTPMMSNIMNQFLKRLDVFERLTTSERGRYNFVNYNFALRCICNELGLNHLVKHIRKIRGPRTLKKQSQLWQRLSTSSENHVIYTRRQ